MKELLRRIWTDEEGQDIAEYVMMLGLILCIVVATVLLIGTEANRIFQEVYAALAGVP